MLGGVSGPLCSAFGLLVHFGVHQTAEDLSEYDGGSEEGTARTFSLLLRSAMLNSLILSHY